MKVPVSWLREYVTFELPLAELARRLVFTSCEVDRIVRLGVPDADGNLGNFLVGRVLEAGKHPNADKLQLCVVDVGDGQPRSIVCGAWNFGAGATVAVALPGAVMPGGLVIEQRKLRGGALGRDDPLRARARARHRPHGDHRAPGRARARHATRGRPARVGGRARDRDRLQPAGPDLDLRDRARGVRPARRRARAAARKRPGAGRERGRRRPDRRLRGLPALRRPPVPRRHDRAVAGLAQGPPDRRRDAPDLQRRRRHQLRDDRPRAARSTRSTSRSSRAGRSSFAAPPPARSCARSTACCAGSISAIS